MTLTAAIIGAQGYSGRELARLLLRHPHIHLTQVYTRNPEWRLTDELPELLSTTVKHGLVEELSTTIPRVDMIFLATPHEASMELALKFHGKIKWIIDLSGAFRLPVETFGKWYQQHHITPELLAMAQYGLCPWQQQPATGLIANPGCYATAVLMALLPLAAAGLVPEGSIIIDAKSGVSGAGRTAKAELLFGEVADNFYPYKVGKHQHTPEIQHTIQAFTQVKINPILTTQVLPLMRGISAAIYIPCMGAHTETIKKVTAAYEHAYVNYPLIRYAYLPDLPSKAQHQFLALRSVAGSCRTQVSYQCVDDYLVVFSLIDNLLKGAASQAIENANRILHLPLACGLENFTEN